tara:strand:- start:296 stop:466 length:171 start_codon:yes stop_codon:yes gene_type:complete
MGTPINRTKRLIRMLERLLQKDDLYTDDQIQLMRDQLKIAREELVNLKSQNFKGFK